MMSVGKFSLKRCGFDGIDWQNGQQNRVSPKRLLIRAENAAASLRDRSRRLLRGPGEFLDPTFRRRKALCSRLRFAGAPPRWCTFDHARDSILVAPPTCAANRRELRSAALRAAWTAMENPR